MKKSNYIIIAIILAIILVLLFIPKNTNAPQPVAPMPDATTTVATTTEIVAPAPLPRVDIKYVPVTKATTTLRMDETAIVNDVMITVARIGDNRARGGEARTLLKIQGPQTYKNVDMFEGQGVMIDGMLIVLVDVYPEYKKGKTIPEGDYRFVTTVEPKSF